jgi:serine/threonine protein kinase
MSDAPHSSSPPGKPGAVPPGGQPPRLQFMPTPATFRLMEPIGVGAIGTVYRAESDEIHGPIAVKVLHSGMHHAEGMVDRFQREIVVMERLSHPHIVRHYGGGMLDGQYFFAMELLARGTLRDRIRENGPVPWRQAAQWLDDVASALQHAHNHGIIHRDLKPTNLFFADDGRLVLGDFGVALDVHAEELTYPGKTVGTYAYMSPEQICADRTITGQSDLYALGCVAYEMLSGKPPFAGANFAQIWDQHLHAAPKSLRSIGIDCPEWLDHLVLQLLEKEPHKRPFNARAVQGVIRSHLAEGA